MFAWLHLIPLEKTLSKKYQGFQVAFLSWRIANSSPIAAVVSLWMGYVGLLAITAYLFIVVVEFDPQTAYGLFSSLAFCL